jgi:hypothetical protein
LGENQTTEKYYAKETSHYFADIGKKDNGGPDDVYVSQQTLRSLSGALVGSVVGYGVNLRRPYVFFHYTGTDQKGSITLEGAVNLRQKTETYVISGGTAGYAGAEGTVTSTDAGAKGTLVVIRYRK